MAKKKFTIYANGNNHIDAVKKGWSWPAFFFGPIWAIVKKMYLLGFGLLIVAFGLGVLSVILQFSEELDDIVRIMLIGVSVVFGLMGNSWIRVHKLTSGYEEKQTIIARTKEEAIQNYG